MNLLSNLLGTFLGNKLKDTVEPSLPSLPGLSSANAQQPVPVSTPAPMSMPGPSVTPESLSPANWQTPAEQPKGIDYHDTFMRTPDDENKAKAADEIRKLLYPEKPAVRSEMSPQQSTKIDEQIKKTEAEKAKPVFKKPAEAKKPEAPKADPEAEALNEMEREVGEEPRTPNVLEKLLNQFKDGDKELDSALEQRRKDLAMASIMKGTARIGNALATQGNKTLKQVSPDAFADFEKQAMLPVEDIKAKREARDQDIKQRQGILSAANAEMQLQSDEVKRDPKSEVSEMYRKVIGQAMPELKIPSNISAFELEKLVGPLQNAANMKLAMETKKETAQMNADLRKAAADERAERQKEREDNNTFKEQERYQNQLSKIDTKHREATKYMDEASAMAEQATKNPQAATNLARGVIKAIEGAGARVSDKDYTSAVGDAALGAKLANMVNSMAKGTIRDVTKNDILLMLDASRKIQQRKYEESIKVEVERYAKRAKTSPEEAADLGIVNKDILKTGAAPQAGGGSKPTANEVVQDGNVFKLNPQTGEYEFVRKQ